MDERKTNANSHDYQPVLKPYLYSKDAYMVDVK